jgi:hypothetical protein
VFVFRETIGSHNESSVFQGGFLPERFAAVARRGSKDLTFDKQVHFLV